MNYGDWRIIAIFLCLLNLLYLTEGLASQDQHKENFINQVSKLYTDGMRRHDPNQGELYWGGNLEVEMAARHLQKQILIHEPDQDKFSLIRKTDYAPPRDTNNHINIIFCGGNHYKAYVQSQAIDTKGDGNCLFASILLSNVQRNLSDYQNNLTDDIRELRHSVCDLLEAPGENSLRLMLGPVFEAEKGTFLDQLEGLPRPLRPLVLNVNPSPPILSQFDLSTIRNRLDFLSYDVKHKNYSEYFLTSSPKKSSGQIDVEMENFEENDWDYSMEEAKESKSYIYLSSSKKRPLDSKFRREEFYVFGLGQGNSQLAVYEKSDFAVLYDCGSSSLRTHPKYIERETDKEKTMSRPLLEVKKPTVIQSGTIYKKDKKQILKSTGDSQVRQKLTLGILKKNLLFQKAEGEKEKNSNNPSSKEPSLGTNEDSTTYVKIREFIRDTIARYHIHHLFVFLSHSDKDHINLISPFLSSEKHIIVTMGKNVNQRKKEPTVIPEVCLDESEKPTPLNVTAFLCGDWFWTDNDSESSMISLDVADYLIKRSNTQVEFPYYWQYDYDKKFYEELIVKKRNRLKTPLIKHTNRYLRYTDQQATITTDWLRPPFYAGTLRKLIEKISMRTYKGHFDFVKNECPDLDNVMIHSMNHEANNKNDQSTILSFDMEDIGVRFVCTGDVGDDHDRGGVIRTLFENKEKTEKKLMYPHKYPLLTALVVPHHGSYKNLSPYLGYIFNPDFLIVSAGNGKVYGHPSIQLRNFYKYLSNDSRFYNKYDYERKIFDNLVLAFDDKEQASTEGWILYNPKNPPLISTNILGTFRFDSTGIYTSYAPIIKFENSGKRNGEYSINLAKSIIPKTPNSPLKREVNVYRNDENLYLKIENKFYLLNKI